MKVTMINQARETINVAGEDIVIPEWVEALRDRSDIVDMDYGYAGRFMVVKCKTKEGLHFVFREEESVKLTANIHHNFIMDTNHRLAKIGLTHFFEHMMFKRVKFRGKYLKSETLNKKAAEYGIKLNAFTGVDGVVTNCRMNPEVLIKRNAEYLEEAASFRKLAGKYLTKPDFADVKVFFDMVYGLSYDHKIVDEDIESEKKVVKSEIARSKDDPWALYKATNAVMFGKDKAYDFFGKASDIDNITAQDCIDIGNILIDGCIEPQTRHVLTGNFSAIPEVIDMWIDTIKKVLDKREKLDSIEIFDRTYFNHIRKLGGTNIKDSNLIKKTGKLLHYDVDESRSSEIDMYCEFDPNDSKWSGISDKYRLRTMVFTLIVGMSNDMSAPLMKIFREELGWTYGVSSVSRSISVQDEFYVIGWDMVLGDHVHCSLDTLRQARKIINDLELTNDMIKTILKTRATKLFSGLDKMIYNVGDHPYGDTIKLSEWHKVLDPLTDVSLDDWKFVWNAIRESLYYWLLEGTCDKESSDDE